MTLTKDYLNSLERDITKARNRLEAAHFLLRRVETREFDWFFKHVMLEGGVAVVHTYPSSVKIERCVFAGIELHLADTEIQYRVLQTYEIAPAQWGIFTNMADMLGRMRLERFEIFLKQDEKWRNMFTKLICSEYSFVDFNEASLYEDFHNWEELIELQEALEEAVPKSNTTKKPAMKI